MHGTIEKKSLASKTTVPDSKSYAIHSRRVDLNQPVPVRIETCRASGDKRIRYLRLAARELGWSTR